MEIIFPYWMFPTIWLCSHICIAEVKMKLSLFITPQDNPTNHG